MSLDLQIKSRKVKNIPVLDLEGEVDVYTYPVLRDALQALLKDGQTVIAINLENVSYIDSTGLGVLANSANKISGKNGELRLICSQPHIIKIFTVAGLLGRNLKIFPGEAEALGARKPLK
ncbi:MAG: STAS domain-containing protein [Candidatus Margulisbacteria bacterium]|jgi:anti-sigma B factor antagonist|nr:STAS domain-containing protein [Candidatus Margulisiibacteriota bacterium]